MKAHQGKIVLRQNLVIVGEMTISGALIPIQNLAEEILIEIILLPDNSEPLLNQVPSDILEDIEIMFYKDPIKSNLKHFSRATYSPFNRRLQFYKATNSLKE